MEIIPIESIKPSTYNPRKADEERLQMVELSLKKLGFILPIYSTVNGEILSGHQRQYVASKMGFKHIPVEWVDKELTLEKRKNINILFNQATNEAPRSLTPQGMKKKLKTVNLQELADQIPDKDMDNPREIFRCYYAEDLPLDKVVEKNYLRFDNYYSKKNYNLMRVAKTMPLIVNKDYEIINGIGRISHIVTKKKKDENIKCVVLKDEEVEFADYMLNYVSMDFDIHNKYRDELRQNSFRRHIKKDIGIGTGFIAKLVKNPYTVKSKFSPNLKEAFKKEYGERIVDFGAGHMINTRILNKNGFYCIPFEPFVIDFDKFMKLDYEKSVEVCRNFLKEYQEDSHFDTVFLHSVFNSVPFEEDRQKILTILAEIADNDTKVILWTQHVKAYIAALNSSFTETSTKGSSFLDYEKNIVLADTFDKPKVQKYYDEKDLISLCRPYFQSIKTRVLNSMIYCELTKPIKPSKGELDEALDFEFNLKHTEGGRLGLNKEAKKVFHKVRKDRESGV